MSSVLKHPVVTGLRRMFILVSPNETSFEKLEDVPNYVDEVSQDNTFLFFLEKHINLYIFGKRTP